MNQIINHYPLYSIVAKPCHQLLSQESLVRCTVTLSAYNFTIGHKPGRDLGNADASSYLPQPETTDKDCLPGELVHLMNYLSATTTNISSIKRGTDIDPVLSQVCDFLLQGWPTTQLDDKIQPYRQHKDKLSV